MADAEQILDEQEVETQEPEVEENQEAESTEAEETTKAEPDLEKRIAGLESALSETRKGKQELQRQLDYLSGALEHGKPQPQKQSEPEFDVTEDDFWGDIPGTLKRVYYAGANAAVSSIKQEQHSKRVARIDRRWAKMKSKDPEYAEAEQAFLEAIKHQPSLLQESWDDEDPVGYVYEWHKSRKTPPEVDELKQRIAELEAQITGGKPPVKPPPKTQAGKRQAGPASVGDETNPWANNPLDRV